MEYEFKVDEVFKEIEDNWKKFSSKLGNPKWVLGISGGKDSTVVADLAVKIFGKDKVIGVSMPNGVQKDMSDVNEVFWITGIKRLDINIKNAYCAIFTELYANMIDATSDARINLAPRLRMSTLYAVAQSCNGVVLNTDNLCERLLGYSTLWGDSVGSYAPIQNLTVEEVVKLGEYMNLPDRLVKKIPGDGLQDLGDEDRLGITYKAVHDIARLGKANAEDLKKFVEHYNKNKFKMEMIHLPGPEFSQLPLFDIKDVKAS